MGSMYIEDLLNNYSSAISSAEVLRHSFEKAFRPKYDEVRYEYYDDAMHIELVKRLSHWTAEAEILKFCVYIADVSERLVVHFESLPLSIINNEKESIEELEKKIRGVIRELDQRF